MSGRVPGLMLGVILAAAPSAALAQTSIVADVGAKGLGTTVTTAGTTLTIDGGTRSGNNLFHSFSGFSVGAGDTARWVRGAGDGATVLNVINRVTGGQASNIAGVLDSTALPNASFFFINPAGIVFGAGAKVNVPAGAYFSTAQELRFADGTRFAMTTPGGSSLSVAAPESFGFVGGQGDIAVSGAQINVGDAKLSFAAANISVQGGQLFGGALDLTAAGAGPATVALAAPPAAASGALTVRASQVGVLSASGALRMTAGAVTLDAANVVSDTQTAARGGDIVVQAASLSTRNGSTLGVSSRGAGAAGDLTINAGTVVADGGSLFSVATGAGPGGRIALNGGDVTLGGFASLASTVSGSGRGGDISLTARNLTVESGFIVSSSLGTSRGGDIAISAPNQSFVNGLAVTSSAATGRPGNVTMTGETISVSGGAFGSSPGGTSDSGDLTILATRRFDASLTSFVAATLSDNTAGSILIRSPTLVMENSHLTSSAFGAGGAGKVQLQGTDIFLDQTQLTAEARGPNAQLRGLVEIKASGRLQLSLSQLASNAYGLSNGGMVTIEGNEVVVDNSQITSDTFGDGGGGLVKITAASSLTLHLGEISSSSLVNGDAGDVSITAGLLHLDQASKIRSDTADMGRAGTVNVKAGRIEVLDQSSITSEATGGFGDAGAVTIVADRIDLTDGFISSDTKSFGNAGAVRITVGDLHVGGAFQNGFTYITSDTFGAGHAGGVFIDAQTAELKNGGFVSSTSIDEGDAGRVEFRAKTLTLRDGGFIASDTFGPGHAGNVVVVADTLKLTGAGDFASYISSDAVGGDGDAGTVNVTAKSVSLDHGAYISSDTSTFGDAGDVVINASDSLSLDAAAVSSSTFSGGRAGNVTIAAGRVNLDHGAAISSQAALRSLGAAGQVAVTADQISVGDRALISTSSSGAGDAGQLRVAAKTSLMLNGGLISSAAERGSAGRSGQLFVDAGTLSVLGGGGVSTTSNNANAAGQITIRAGAITVDGARSLISSENPAGDPATGGKAGTGGDAGAILISAGGLTVSNGGRITTNAFAGAAGRITIDIPRPGLLVLKGADAPGVIQTSSGRATGGEITITDPLAIISNGGSILALGQQRGANVLIQSRYFINSTDRTNTVAVDGEVRLETGLYDVSSGTVTRDISVVDASKVLRGQCPAARASGVVSQLVTRPVGPYVREPDPAPPAPPDVPGATAGGGGCR